MITTSFVKKNTSPRKMFYKVVAIHANTIPQILADWRLVPRYATKKIVTGIRVLAKSNRSKDPVFKIYGCGQFLNEKKGAQTTFPWAHLGHHLVTQSL
jgi:hypothetical protein